MKYNAKKFYGEFKNGTYQSSNPCVLQKGYSPEDLMKDESMVSAVEYKGKMYYKENQS